MRHGFSATRVELLCTSYAAVAAVNSAAVEAAALCRVLVVSSAAILLMPLAFNQP
jgi:hypothetical protein